MDNTLFFRILGENVEFGKFSAFNFFEISKTYIAILKKIVKYNNPKIGEIDYILNEIRHGSFIIEATPTHRIESEKAVESFLSYANGSSRTMLYPTFSSDINCLAKSLKNTGASLEVRDKHGHTNEIDTDKLLFELQTINEFTTVYGKLIQVGGKREMNIHLESIFTGKKIICNIRTIEQARELGSRIYEVVGLRGIATVSITNKEIEEFEVTEILPYRESEIENNLAELRVVYSEMVKDMDNLDDFYRKLRED